MQAGAKYRIIAPLQIIQVYRQVKVVPASSDKSVEKLKVPPHSIEAEQAVLGSMLIDPESWDKVSELVTDAEFYNRSHQIVFKAILDLLAQSQPVDLITVSELLENNDQLEDAGGFAYLGELARNTPSSANVTAYAKIIRERAITRELIGVANEIAEVGYNPEGRDSADILDMAESKVFEIAERRTGASEGPQSIESVLGKTIDRLEALIKDNREVTGVTTGFSDLDKKTSGMQPSDLIIVAARPSMGKCIVSGSRLVDPLSGRRITIDEMVKSQYGEVTSLDNHFTLCRAKISQFVDDGVKPVFEVRTALGRKIQTTLSHPFLTGAGWRKLENISVGDRIGVPRALAIFGDRSLPEHEVKALAYFVADGGTTQSNPLFTNVNRAIVADFIHAMEQFNGAKVSQANFDYRAPSYRVSGRAEKSAEQRKRFANYLKGAMQHLNLSGKALAARLGLQPATISQWCNGGALPLPQRYEALCCELGADFGQQTQTVYEAGSTKTNSVVRFLKAHSVWGYLAHEKSVPEAIFSATRASVALFLNRLFACDGSISVYKTGQVRVSYGTASESLAYDVQHLLLRFGIIAKLRAKTSYARRQFEVEIISRAGIDSFIRQIGIFGKETQVEQARATLAEKRQHSNVDALPESAVDYVKQLKGSASWAEIFARKGLQCPQGFNPHLSGQSRRLLSRSRARFYAELFDDAYLSDLANSDLYWDEVQSIEYVGNKQVYDLTVPELHNFVAEDICVHNTTFAMNLAENAMLAEDKRVLVFSLEMPSEQIMMRMLASLSRVDQTKIRTAQLDDEDWARISNTMAMLKEKDNIYVDDSSGLTPMDVRSRARKLARERGGLSMIMVDYLQLMRVPSLSDNRTLEIAEISRSLKALAKELNIPVIALSQLNRSLEQRADKRPVNSDLRESGSIEQDADLIMFIYRDEVYHENSEDKGVAEIIIGKQRNGPIGTCRLTFQGQFSRFDNYAGPAVPDEY